MTAAKSSESIEADAPLRMFFRRNIACSAFDITQLGRVTYGRSNTRPKRRS